MKRRYVGFSAILLLFSSYAFASIERCRLDSILGAVRTLQSDSSKTLGKVCTILEKVCDLQTTLSFNITVTSLEEILEKVCTIEDTTSLTLEKVCDIQNTDTQILEKVCDIQATISLISTITSLEGLIEKVCDIQNTTSLTLEKVCDIQITDSRILEKVCDIQESLSLIPTLTQLEIILEKVCDIQTTTTETLRKVCTILDTDTQILQKVCDIQESLTFIETATEIPIILDKVCTILDTDTQILEKVCNLQLTVSALACAPFPIFSAQTISVPGVYCLANSVVGQMTIASSDVDLDLNRHRISGGTNGVVVNSGLTRVTIRNGIIGPVTEDGIRVNANASNVMIEDIKTINCGITGINLDQVNNSSIEKCDLTSNVTGLTLDHSYKILVDSCKAKCNRLAAFSLLMSNTNCFTKCKALSTGQGATGDATNVFGFKSFSGFGNIFEHCIANSTQALTTTVQEGIAAGFAFTGTEVCSKIINCEAANATTSPDGIAIPYGIFLESRFQPLDAVSSVTALVGTVNEVDWSPDGRFLAKVGSTITPFSIFQFNGTDLTEVATLGALGVTVNSVKWSPNGKFVAIGGDAFGGFEVNVFAFNGTALTLVATALTASLVQSVDWSPDGKFLAIGDFAGGLNVSRFTGSSLVTVATLATGATINSVDWSPDGKFVATGGALLAGSEINVYRFNTITASLTLVASAVHGGIVFSVDWSPDGKFLAMGGGGGLMLPSTRVFQFTGASLIQVATASGLGKNSVDWSPDGKFLASGGITGLAPLSAEIFVYQFTRTGLTLVSTAQHGGLGNTINSVDWSPDGSFLAAGGNPNLPSSDFSLQIFSILNFPNRNLIKNNIVYCNLGNECPAGVGISGSSLKNCIVGNTAYENVRNYEFVTNVVNEEFNTLSLNPAGIGGLLNASCNELNLESPNS